MAEITCLICVAFDECPRRLQKSSKYRLHRAPHRFFDMCRLIAGNCKEWKENTIIVAQVLEHGILKSIIKTAEEGKVIALINGSSPPGFLGGFDNLEHAKASNNGNHAIFLLPATQQEEQIH